MSQSYQIFNSHNSDINNVGNASRLNHLFNFKSGPNFQLSLDAGLIQFQAQTQFNFSECNFCSAISWYHRFLLNFAHHYSDFCVAGLRTNFFPICEIYLYVAYVSCFTPVGLELNSWKAKDGGIGLSGTTYDFVD